MKADWTIVAKITKKTIKVIYHKYNYKKLQKTGSSSLITTAKLRKRLAGAKCYK